MSHVLTVYCPCGHRAVIPQPQPWQPRDVLLRRLRCSKCGGRPTDLIVSSTDAMREGTGKGNR